MKAPAFIDVCGVRTPVRVGTPDDHPDLKGAYGCYDVETSTIWLNADVPPHALEFWLTHEALHAILNSSGAYRMTAAAFGLDPDKPRDRARLDVWEENIIRVLTPHVLSTFGSIRRARRRSS